MKKGLFLIVGIGAMLILFSSFSMSDEISFNGCHFSHAEDQYEHDRDIDGSIHQDTSSGWMTAPMVFPDSATGMNVTRFSVTYVDNTASAYVRVRLYKTDRWTGTSTEVAELESGVAEAAAGVQYMNMPKSQMTGFGIDNNRYAWYLYLWFSDGTGASHDLKLHQVTVRYE